MANLFKNRKVLIALASFCMAVTTFFAVGCDPEVENINISKNNMPQLVYVQGNELNLSEGVLTVVIGEERSEISLTDPEVKVSGYNKDVIGEQVLTIEYKGQTTVLKVNVVPRMSVSKYETGYFVGESFNFEKGEFLITADNGESKAVKMSDPAITLSGFTSETANPNVTITATYQKDDVTYSTTFSVGVYAIENVEFKSPNKKFYQNHEEDLDVAGGYLSLECAEMSRYVLLTEDMVSGFDLTAATVEHREEALEQVLTVSYLGQTKEYTIQIKFSDLSLITLRANEMKSLNWTSSELPAECTEEMGENALEAMEVYFEMNDTEKNQIAEGDMDYIVKVATMYGLKKWQTAFASYSDAFYLNEQNSLVWNCEDFEKTQAAYENILNKDPILYNDATTLVKIREEFAETVIFDEETVGDTLAPVYKPEVIDEFAEQLNLMISLHLAMKDVPDEWTLDLLRSTYADTMQAVWELLYETEYKATVHRSLYHLVSRWRTNNDYFEILYEYYYNDAENSKRINDFKDLRLPGELEGLYQLMLGAREQVVYIQNGYQMDTSNFMFFYEQALKMKEEVLQSTDEMILDLYKTLEFDYLIGDGQGGYTLCTFEQLFSQFRRMTGGYLSNFNVYLGVEEYEALFDEYMAVLEKLAEVDGYLDSTDYGADVEKLLADYLNLSPKQQFSFMCLLHPYYEPTPNGRYPLFAWENDGNGFHSQFVFLIYNHYEKILPESTHEIFSKLMLAGEGLANLQLTAPINTFLDNMDAVHDLGERLSERRPEDWATFNTVLEDVLLHFEELYEKFKLPEDPNETYVPVTEELSDAEKKDFENLLNSIVEAYSMMMVYQSNPGAMVAYYAAMEKVERYSNKILESEDPRILRAYYYDEMILEGVKFPDGQTVNFGGTMDFLVWLVRDTYITSMISASYLTNGYLMWDAYHDLEIGDFFMAAAKMYYDFIYMNLLPEADPNYVYFKDVDGMKNIAKMFREDLNVEQRHFMLTLDSSFRMYQNSMTRFGKERNAQMGTIVQQLMQVEYMYVFYEAVPDGEHEGRSYKDMLIEEYDSLMTIYNELVAMVEEEKQADSPNEAKVKAVEDFTTYFGEMFDFYREKCEAVKALPNE